MATATPEIYTLSLHDALPISLSAVLAGSGVGAGELRVVDRFEPGDLLALFVVLLGGEMGHERVLARSVPVLLQRRDPHRLTGLDRQHRAIAADDQSGAVGAEQRLADR